jgi:hypothetical protein
MDTFASSSVSISILRRKRPRSLALMKDLQSARSGMLLDTVTDESEVRAVLASFFDVAGNSFV